MIERKRVLVTGGAGFIGSIFGELLVDANYQLIVLDDLRTGHIEAVHPKAEFFMGSTGDQELIKQIFSKFKIYATVFFAGTTLVTHANTNPQDYYLNNLKNTLNFLKVMLEHECRRIVFSSSAAVYGNPVYAPIDESHPTRPLNAYGRTKLIIENILNDYSVYGLKSTSFRYFNPAGASQNYGEQHDDETHLIPLILQTALGQRENISILGTDYDTPDGTAIRDYVHVIDVARAHILAVEKINQIRGIYNIGSESESSVMEVINTVKKVTNREISIKLKERRLGDPPKLIASCEKIRKELGWKPLYPDLEQIIASAWTWQKTHPRGYNSSINDEK